MAWAALGKKLATGAVKGKAKKIATDKLLNRKKKPRAKRPSLDELIAEVRGSGPEADQVKGGALVVRPTTSLVPSPGGAIQKHTGVDGEYGSVEDNVIRIKSKVIAIDGILKGTLAAEKARKADAAAAQEASEQAAAEKKLEAKPKKKKKGMKLKAPKQVMGLWERLKTFFTTIVFGYIGMQLIPLLPKLIPLAKGLLGIVDKIIFVAGKILDFVVTFIDWSYKLYDMGMGLIKNLVGEKGAKLIEDLMGHLNTLINGFLVWKIVGEKIFKAIVAHIKRVFRIAKVIFKKVAKFAKNIIKNALNFAKNIAQRVGRNLMKIPGVKNVVSNVAKTAGNLLGKGANLLSKGKGLLGKAGGIFKVGGKAAAGKVGGIAGKIFGKAAKFIAPAIKGAMPAVKGFLGRIPIMGPLIVGIVSLLTGDPPGKAIFKALGAALGGALGTFIPIPVLGTLIGETIGVFVGELLYYLIIKRDPKAAFQFLKDSFMKIFNVGKNIFLFFKEGFGRFIDTFPMVKFPAQSIGNYMYRFLALNPIYKAVMDFKVPDWGFIPKGMRGFSINKLLNSLPSIPEVLGTIFNLHPLLKMLVKDGKVEGFPAIWQLMNPVFMIKHLKESFFPSSGGPSKPAEVQAKTTSSNKKEEKKEKKKKEDPVKKEKRKLNKLYKKKIEKIHTSITDFVMGVGEAMKIPLVEEEADTPKLQVSGATTKSASSTNEKISSVSSHASYEEGAGSTVIIQNNSSTAVQPSPKSDVNPFATSSASGEDPYESLDQFG